MLTQYTWIASGARRTPEIAMALTASERYSQQAGNNTTPAVPHSQSFSSHIPTFPQQKTSCRIKSQPSETAAPEARGCYGKSQVQKSSANAEPNSECPNRDTISESRLNTIRVRLSVPSATQTLSQNGTLTRRIRNHHNERILNKNWSNPINFSLSPCLYTDYSPEHTLQ